MIYAFALLFLLLKPLWSAATAVYHPYHDPRQAAYAQMDPRLDPRYMPQTPIKPPESIDDICQRVLTNPRSQNLTKQTLVQQDIPRDIIVEIQENISKQQPEWQAIVADYVPERAIQLYLEGVRINPTDEVSIHLQKAQKSPKIITWNVDFIGVWIIQYVEKYCTQQKVDLLLLNRELQNVKRIIPERFRNDFNTDDLLQKIESSMIWKAIVQTAGVYVSDTRAKWYQAALTKKNLFPGKKPPKPPIDPWIVEVFEKEKFNALKDEKIFDLWRNLQGVSGNFDIVSRSITSEIESLSREEVDPLYKKNIAAFLRSFSQQFQDQVQRAPLGVAAWLYSQLDGSLRTMWQKGPHFQPTAFQQWRGDKESIDTLSVDGIQLAILSGIRDVEAKNAGRPQKIQEISRFLEGWKQRFQSTPKIMDIIQAVESDVDEVVESTSAWPILTKISEQAMTPKGYQALMKEYPKLTKIPPLREWEKVRKIKRSIILPWGKEIAERLPNASKNEDKSNSTDALSQFANKLFAQGASGSKGPSTGGGGFSDLIPGGASQSSSSASSAASSASSAVSSNNGKIDNNKLLQDGIKQFVGALGLKI